MFSYSIADAQCTLSASSSGGNGAYTQVYVLVDSGDNIVAVNSTGIFPGVASGNYQIHALNYDPGDPPVPLPTVGTSVNSVGMINGGCYNADFLTDFVNRSCTPNTCVNSSTVCQGDDFVISSSGSTSGYTQVYVLTNPDGTYITSIETTGAATFDTSLLTDGNTYQVYALNYNPSNPPSPLPSSLNPGDLINDVGSVTSGCFNADFTTDFVCFQLNCTCTAPVSFLRN